MTDPHAHQPPPPGGGQPPPPGGRRNPWLAVGLVVLVLAILIGAAVAFLADGDDDADVASSTDTTTTTVTAVSTSTTAAPTTTSVAPTTTAPTATTGAPTSRVPAASGPTNEAEPGLNHDIGTIDEVFVGPEGTTWIRFNRYQRFDGASGTDFSEPPRNAGATDVQYLDSNPRLRTYPVSARVSVGEISNYQALCDFSEDVAEYAPTDLSTLVAKYPDGLKTVSFDEFGEVFDVSDERSC